MRARALVAFIGSLTFAVGVAPSALAANTGGVAPSAPTPSAGAPARKAASPAPIHASPITARTPTLAYHGPVYQRLPGGEVIPYQPYAPGGGLGSATGGSPVGVAASSKPQLLVPGSLARYVGGQAAAPMAAPAAVQQVIWAGNQIIGLPYIFGGGHASFDSPGYDCSGTVSFALHGGALLATPEDSSEFESWGSHGAGRWIAIFANPGHAYMAVAGLRLDTSAADDPSQQQGPRWRPLRSSNGGYTIRHPLGL